MTKIFLKKKETTFHAWMIVPFISIFCFTYRTVQPNIINHLAIIQIILIFQIQIKKLASPQVSEITEKDLKFQRIPFFMIYQFNPYSSTITKWSYYTWTLFCYFFDTRKMNISDVDLILPKAFCFTVTAWSTKDPSDPEEKPLCRSKYLSAAILFKSRRPTMLILMNHPTNVNIDRHRNHEDQMGWHLVCYRLKWKKLAQF